MRRKARKPVKIDGVTLVGMIGLGTMLGMAHLLAMQPDKDEPVVIVLGDGKPKHEAKR